MRIGDVATGAEGSFFVADREDYAVLKFNRQGRLEGEFGRHGEGPGEFLRGPFVMSSLGDTLAIADFTTSIVHVVTSDLEFVRTFRAPRPIWHLSFTGEGLLCVAFTNLLAEACEVELLDTSGNLHGELKLQDPPSPPAFCAVSLCSDEDGLLLMSFLYVNRVEIFGPDGHSRARFHIPGLPGRAEEESVEPLGRLPAGNMTWDIDADGRGHIFVLGGDYSSRECRDVYVLDYEGQLITTFALPEETRTVHLDRQGSLFATAADRTIVKKYLLTYCGFP